MKKVLAVFLLFFVLPVFAEEPLAPIIVEHIIDKRLTFVTHFGEEINDIPGKGIVLVQQEKAGHELNKGSIILSLLLYKTFTASVDFYSGKESIAVCNIVTKLESNLILLKLAFQDRPDVWIYLRFHSGDPLFYFSYTYPEVGWIEDTSHIMVRL